MIRGAPGHRLRLDTERRLSVRHLTTPITTFLIMSSMLALYGCGGGGGGGETNNVPPPPPANDEDYVSNIVYCQADGLDLEMDKATNSSFSGLRPAVILVHGGGWFDGHK